MLSIDIKKRQHNHQTFMKMIIQRQTIIAFCCIIDNLPSKKDNILPKATSNQQEPGIPASKI